MGCHCLLQDGAWPYVNQDGNLKIDLKQDMSMPFRKTILQICKMTGTDEWLCYYVGLRGPPWSMDCKKWAESAQTPFVPSDTKCQELFSLSTGETQTADDHGADSPGGKLASGSD